MQEKNGKILIVDDEKTNLDVLVGLLQDEYKTIVAKNGEQALKRAATAPQPELILLDIMMPDIDGYEVCRRLKNDPETADIPIIFITGKESVQDETMALEAGGVDFIRKPFSPTVVMARIRTHLALHRQRTHLLELNALKNKFLGMAAHDLRNPLNSICGYSDILLTMTVEEGERIRFTQTIFDVASQMLHLINDLLDVSVIESGHFVLHQQSGDLADLVAERVQLMTFTAEKKGVSLVTDLQATPSFLFDRERLAQVVDNLLSNAIKFSPKNTDITVSTGQQREGVFLRVSDQGPGIPETERHQLYGAFQKLSVRPTGAEKSTGLGLSIVKRIMDAHQGVISVVNNEDRGATFTCFFPVGQTMQNDR
ncbi:MAG: hybrid sensor histidine kinase/response regulator [Magnetococcales bacterium]|nr:hybrid sensor histidine kinase/response regulator [Magnetococcales bacterium]